ncbi:hypothetical protein [Psychromonas ossibalaenae]|uniref:hypothetical protein n=1 Tax=Psychromonas ossibalaenae TaxID=444922 RepID=UPI000370B59B|nr:hypothetical protein [Psychromonas ossibalaenae]
MKDHGVFKLALENNILIVEGRGPWNKEALKISFDNAKMMLNKKEKWGIIAVMYGEPVYTPDAAEMLIERIKYEKTHGRTATAFILTNSISPELGKRHLSDLCSKADETFQFFNRVIDAEIWMKSLLSE